MGLFGRRELHAPKSAEEGEATWKEIEENKSYLPTGMPIDRSTGDRQEGGYGHQRGWWGEGSASGAMTREEAGLSDDRAYQRALELSQLAEGKAGVQQWETDLRKELNEAARKLYSSAGRAGPNRAALARALRGGMAQKGQEVERLIKTAREEEQTKAAESLEDLLITTRKEGASTALAKQGMHQQWLMAQESNRTQTVSSVIGGVASLAGVAIMAFSDQVLKENIEPIPNPLEKVRAINGVTWDWKSGPEDPFQMTPLGFIAQNVEGVVPEVVHYDADGVRRIDYPKLTAVLFEAIKELDTKLGEVHQQIADLKGAKNG